MVSSYSKDCFVRSIGKLNLHFNSFLHHDLDILRLCFDSTDYFLRLLATYRGQKFYFFRMVQFLNVRPRISCQIQDQHDDEESFGTISINPYARSLISSHGKSLSFICSKCCDIFIFVADEIYFLQLEQ